MEYRSIQLGLRGAAVHKFVNEWIVQITDISKFVEDLRKQKNARKDIQHLLPQEKIYKVCDS